MKVFTAVIEKDVDTNLYVGYVPSFVGAHSQGETLDELRENLQEVIAMLLEDDVISLYSLSYLVLTTF
jgi:predicted RNase H-like HicB family nuclease